MHNTPICAITFNTGNDLIAPHDLIGVLDRSGATLAGLQELSPRNAEALRHATLPRLPHRITYGEYIEGKGLLSAYPIQYHDRFGLPSGRSAIDARIDIAQTKIAVFVVHPPPPAYRRFEVLSRSGLGDIMQVLERLPSLPTLVLGDFNFVRPSRGYRLLQEAGLIDVFRAVGRGPGLTYPARHQNMRVRLPRVFRLDYIWISPHFVPVRSWVGASFGSDHFPLFSELILRSPS